MEEGGQAVRAAKKHLPEAGIDGTFQHLSRLAMQFQSPHLAKGVDPAATGMCCPVPHTWAVWGPEMKCPFPKQVPGLCLGTWWFFCYCHAEEPFLWRGKAPSSPAPASAWMTCSWPGGGKDKCHLGCSRRSGRAGDTKILSDSQIPPWTSAVVSLCHVPSALPDSSITELRLPVPLPTRCISLPRME